MKVFGIFIVIPLCFLHELGSACNSYYGGYGHGLFGDDYGHGNPHVHMNVHGHGGYYNQYGQGHHGIGGLVDSLLRTDFGGSHHHHHHRPPLVPLSHHRHVHRVHRRSVHSRRSHTTST